jgi:hypothetical protein
MARNTAAEKPREYVGCALSEVQRKKGDGKAAARKAVETKDAAAKGRRPPLPLREDRLI